MNEHATVPARVPLTRGVVSARYGGAPITSSTHAPDPGLEGAVQRVWEARWELTDRAPHTIQMVSDPCVNLAIEAGRTRVVGVWTKLWQRTLEGSGAICAVKLHAGAVQRLLPGPAHRLTDRIQPLDAVLDWDIPALEAAVLGPRDPAERMAALQHALRGHLRPSTPAIERAIAAVELIRSQPALRTVDALATELGLPVRTLQRLFRTHVGASPKWVIRHHRLQEAATRLVQSALTSLADLALELGYADQAHFTRDFRRVVGTTPSALLRRHREGMDSSDSAAGRQRATAEPPY